MFYKFNNELFNDDSYFNSRNKRETNFIDIVEELFEKKFE